MQLYHFNSPLSRMYICTVVDSQWPEGRVIHLPYTLFTLTTCDWFADACFVNASQTQRSKSNYAPRPNCCGCLLQSLAWAEISRGGSEAEASSSSSAITSQTTSWWSVSPSCSTYTVLHFTKGFISEILLLTLCANLPQIPPTQTSCPTSGGLGAQSEETYDPGTDYWLCSSSSGPSGAIHQQLIS